MIKDILIAFGVCIAMSLASCNAETLLDVAEDPEQSEGVEAIVSGEIAGGESTRADGAAVDICDGVFPDPATRSCEILVRCTGRKDGTPLTDDEKTILNGGMDDFSGRVFVHYGDGKFKPKDSDNAIMFPTDAEYVFEAFYPASLFTRNHPDMTADHIKQYCILTCAGLYSDRYVRNKDQGYICKVAENLYVMGASEYYLFRTQSSEYKNKYNDVLNAKGVFASSNNPTIRFVGANKFQHVMSKIDLIFNAEDLPDVKTLTKLEFSGLDHLCAIKKNGDVIEFESTTLNSFSTKFNPDLLSVIDETNLILVGNDEFITEIGSIGGLATAQFSEGLSLVDTKKYQISLLVCPQNISNLGIKYVITDTSDNSTTYNTNTVPINLESGKVYNMLVSASSGSVKIVNSSISDWIDGGDSSSNIDSK